MNFFNLHCHSEYSQLDGFCQISKLVERTKAINQTSIALTDHGTLAGSFKFYEECRKNSINPILGIEAYIVKEYVATNRLYHITLLVSNNIGWSNLLKLHKISYINKYYKPRISFEDLFKHKDGLIVLSGCPSGILSRHIRNNELYKAIENLEIFLANIQDFYIEIMDHGIDFQADLNRELRNLAEKYKIPTVATNDCHYAVKEHAEFQDYLVCDQLHTTIEDENRLRTGSKELYIKSASEMTQPPHELEITAKIADMCKVEIKSNGFLLPQIEDAESQIVTLIQEGLKKINKKEYIDRAREEYNIIREANLIGYFLTVYDYVNWAKSQGILVGPGRGSVGGCLIAYLLGIHTVDPIKHKLVFSRFYNAGRKNSLPDIDIDFPENHVGKVREYVRQKYGQERVAHIGTSTYLQPKGAIKLLGRVLGIDFSTSNQYSSVIEDKDATDKLRLKDAQFDKLVDKAKEFEGLATYQSIHAAGIIISPIDLETIIPLRVNDDNGLYVSSWDMKDIEKVGLVKYDFLSLNTLDVIQDTLDQVKIKLEDIPTDDEDTFELISTTNNVGIFQLSSDGISKVANDLVVNSIDDIAVVVALYRPGPINSGLHTKYISRKHGLESVSYLCPELEPVLKDTYGIFVFQEQIIRAVQTLAGFTEIEADEIRKAIGKKIPELMEEQREKFISGCVKNKIRKEIASKIFDEIDEFSGYSFNCSHATGYAYITYYTAYLKAHYPAEFMAAILNNNYTKPEKLAHYLKECKRLKIPVTPPSVIKGSYNFVANNENIVFGLKGIKGIGEKTALKIFEHKYDNFEDFCIKFQPATSLIEMLAEAGTFDEFGLGRNQIIQSAKYISDTVKDKKINPKAKTLFNRKASFNLTPVEELDDKILAQKEYSRLNTYLTYNPLDGVDLITPEEFEGEIFIEGYVSKVREHITKTTKKTMAFVSLVTNLGEIECLIFPKMYSNLRNILQENIYMGVKGIVEENKILVNDLKIRKYEVK